MHRWTEHELAILRKHFETVPSIYDMEPMLPGRGVENIHKKANAIGLRRPNLQDASHAKLLAAMGNEPKTVKEIMAILGYKKNSVNFLLRRARAEGLCHISGAKTQSGRGKPAPIWSKGDGESELTEIAIENAEHEKELAMKRAEAASRPIRRDPFIEAMFGVAA